MKRFATFLSAAALVLAAAFVPAQTADYHQHRFRDAEKWARIFDDPARDEWQRPQEVIRALALAPDATVADIGAGTGYFAVRLARAVPQGRVFGVDAEPDMVRYLAERARREGLANLLAQQAATDDPRLAAPVDLVIVVNTYHHIPARERYFRALRKALKPGGRVAIIDYTPDSPVGPPKSARVPEATVRSEFARAGYALAAEHNFLPYQYFLVFRPQD